MKISAYGMTDTGMVRAGNEDAFLVDEQCGLFAVADGMGGHNSGEVASRMAMEVMHDAIRRAVNGHDSAVVGGIDPHYSRACNLLASAIRLANRAIFEAAASNQGWKGMGTTVAAVLAGAGRLAVAHVGDSRVYLIRDGKISQLTADHSVVAEQLRKGMISAEEARKSNIKNIITRALGQEPQIEVDLQELEPMDGDRLLICSDGLSGMVSDEEIVALINARTSLTPACRDLVEQANAAGGRDNITAVLLAVELKDSLLSGLKGMLFGKNG